MRRRGPRGGRGRSQSSRPSDKLLDLKGLGLRDPRPLERLEGTPDDIELASAVHGGDRTVLVVASRRDGLDLIGWARVARLLGERRAAEEIVIAAPGFSGATRRAAARAAAGGLPLRLVAAPALAESANEVVTQEGFGTATGPFELPGSTTLERVARVVEGASAVTASGGLRRVPSGRLLYLRGVRVLRLELDGDGVAVSFLEPERRHIHVTEANFPRWGLELHESIVQLAQDPRLLEHPGERAERAADRAAASASVRICARSIPWNDQGDEALDWVGVDGRGRGVVGIARSSVGLAAVPGITAGLEVVAAERANWLHNAAGPLHLLISTEQLDGRARQLLESLDVSIETRALDALPESGTDDERAGRRRTRRRRPRREEGLGEGDGARSEAPEEREADRSSRHSARSTREGERSTRESERSTRESERSTRESERSSRESERSSRESERSSRQSDRPSRGERSSRESEGSSRESEGSSRESAGSSREESGEREGRGRGRRRRGRGRGREPRAEAADSEVVDESASSTPETEAAEEEVVLGAEPGDAEGAATPADEPLVARAEGESGDDEDVATEPELALGEPVEAAAESEEAEPPVEPPRRRRARAAICARNDPDTILAALILARERRHIPFFHVCGQDELMDFFRGKATDLDDNTDLLLIGFNAAPIPREIIGSAELFRGRLQWLDSGEWPIEDVEALREAIGGDSIVLTDKPSSPLAPVVEVAQRRSRFTDKLVDLFARRLSENDMDKWGYRVVGLIQKMLETTGDHRTAISPILAGKPGDLPEVASVYAAEENWLEEHDPRMVHFGEYQMAVVRVPSNLDAGEVARRARLRTGARLSLAIRDGDAVVTLASNDEKRNVNLTGVVDKIDGAIDWAHAHPGGDRVGRFRVDALIDHPERVDAVIGEIVRQKSVLYG